jgi:hypothetical protein
MLFNGGAWEKGFQGVRRGGEIDHGGGGENKD